MPEDTPNQVPVTFPVLVVEGIETDDGRYIEPGALSHRALPLAILALGTEPAAGDGHAGATVVGQLETLERVEGPTVTSKETGEPFPEGTYVWRGTGWVNPTMPGANLVTGNYNDDTGTWTGGVLVGNSVTLVADEAELEDLDAENEELAENERRYRRRVIGAKIASTTLCPVPAFADSYVTIDGVDMAQPENRPEKTPDVVIASMWRAAEVGDDVCLPCEGVYDDDFAVSQEKRDKAEEEGHAMPGGRYPIETEEDLDNAIKAVGRAGGPEGTEDDRNAVRKHIIAQAKRLKLEDRIPETWNEDGTLKDQENSVTAASEPTNLFPPAEWFSDPKLDKPTPLTVTDDGRVYGHLAQWNTCHTGFSGRCVQPPKSRQDYSYFNVGAVRALDNTGKAVEVAVGHITMGEGGHADTTLDAYATAAHYDNTNTAVADVAAGEDAHGIWVAGKVRKHATPQQIDVLRSSPLSGDWRNIGGNLELVAALAVNTPGFPVPRARIASGVPVALTAAGVLPPVHPDKPSGAVILDYDQLADAIALRLRGEVPIPGADEDDSKEDTPEEQEDLSAKYSNLISDFTREERELRFALAQAELDGDLNEIEEWFSANGIEQDDFKRKNWVEETGGLPQYIKRIHKHLRRKGMTESQAIATAVNVVKKTCSTGDTNWPGKQQVNPGSQAEACAAVEEWERKKAQARAS